MFEVLRLLADEALFVYACPQLLYGQMVGNDVLLCNVIEAM